MIDRADTHGNRKESCTVTRVCDLQDEIKQIRTPRWTDRREFVDDD